MLKILITRPQIKNKDSFKEELEKKIKEIQKINKNKAEIKIEILEVVKINPNIKVIEEALKEIDNYDLLGFTSQNGVEIFYEFIRKNKYNISNKKFLAIGEKTAKKIKDLFNPINKVVFPKTYTTKSLEKLLSKINQKCIIFRSSMSNKINLPNVKEVYIYNLIPDITQEDIEKTNVKNYDYIILTSSYITKVFFETIINSFGGNNILSNFFINTKFIPIGPLTYKTTLEYINKDLVTKYPKIFTIEEVLIKIIKSL